MGRKITIKEKQVEITQKREKINMKKVYKQINFTTLTTQKIILFYKKS